MVNYTKKIQLFCGKPLLEFFAENDRKVRAAIEQGDSEHLINSDEEKYVESMLQKFSLNAPQIDFDKVTVTDYEKEMSNSRYRGIFPDRTDKVQIIVFHLPYTGNATLLEYQPSQFPLWNREAFLENHNVCFEIINSERNIEQVKSEKQQVITMIKDTLSTLTKDIEDYNSRLSGLIGGVFNARKQRLMENKKILDDLL